jgi:hypothetical protein
LRIKFSSVRSRSEEIIFPGLLALAATIFLLELLSLYSTPVPDSYLWWGDESWLMLEFRNQMMYGVFSHPYAIGSSLIHGSGIIFGNMWIPAICYGIPAALISPERMDIVLLGRSITTIFAFTLLVALYEIVRRLTADRLLALFSAFLLLTSRSFLFTSHSARYDILSALTIIVGVYLLFKVDRPLTTMRAIVTGFLVAASILVTIHVTLALSLAALITILYHAGKRWPGVLAAYAAGAVVFVVLLIAISALRGQSTLFGNSSGTSFALNIHDIPVLRMYSRSVQFANLAQRWGMFRMYGLGYLFIFAAIAIVAIVHYLRKPGRISIPLKLAAIVAILISWFELESAAPPSYLIYILPVLSLGAALALKHLAREDVRTWGIAAVSIMLGIFAFRDIPGRHGKGYHLMTANALAIGAALGAIEQSDSGIHPLVLAFNPAVHEVLRDTSVRLMTTQFIEYPTSNLSVDSVLRNARVNYVLLYASAIKPDYMREVGPIHDALARIATPIWERAGYFTDIGRSYFDTTLSLPDTLRLYRINKPR